MSLPDVQHPARIEGALALAWGLMVTLCVTGYTFGQSNHHVYLLEALRLQHPETLARDWFTNNTLQYHFLYTRLVTGLQQIRLLEAGFFLLYLALALTLHIAWFAIVHRVGGSIRSYMLSVLIYHVSGGGLGLGVYQFLQDGSFLPSNISAVSTLVALALWLNRRLIPASVAVGVAGLFHVNYAILLIGFWGLLSLWSLWKGESALPRRRYALATAIAMTPCGFNVCVAALSAIRHSAEIPLSDFVAFYVRLRHEHHHDPLRWPLLLWASFLWPIPLALVAMRRLPQTLAVRRLNIVLLVVLVIELFAFLFAGVWFISGTIVRLSLYRFSIFAKLITCIYASWLLLERGDEHRRRHWTAIVCAGVGIFLLVAIPFRHMLPRTVPPPQLGLILGAAGLSLFFAVTLVRRVTPVATGAVVALALPVCILFASRQQLGVIMPGEDDAEMHHVCDWARASTPPTALFLTPPQDSIFSLAAERSSVVGFKQVPQLSAELVEWKRRLDDVLAMDIQQLPTPMQRTLDAMDAAYATLPPAHLRDVARRYECDYIVAMSPFGSDADDRLVYVSPGQRYFVYRAHWP